MADKKCPQCGLWNSESALRCDCGYDFLSGQREESYLTMETNAIKNQSSIDMGQLIIGFIGWLIFSLLCNLPFSDPYANEIGVMAVMIVIQLLGYGLAFLMFRKNKRGIGIGIIIASVPYLVGFIVPGCYLGLPFPLSMLPCG